MKTWFYHRRPVFWDGGCYKAIVDLKLLFGFVTVFMFGVGVGWYI